MTGDDVEHFAFETHAGQVVAVGGSLLEVERLAVKHFRNGFTIQELYESGCRVRRITERDFKHLTDSSECRLNLFIKLY